MVVVVVEDKVVGVVTGSVVDSNTTLTAGVEVGSAEDAASTIGDDVEVSGDSGSTLSFTDT